MLKPSYKKKMSACVCVCVCAHSHTHTCVSTDKCPKRLQKHSQKMKLGDVYFVLNKCEVCTAEGPSGSSCKMRNMKINAWILTFCNKVDLFSFHCSMSFLKFPCMLGTEAKGWGEIHRRALIVLLSVRQELGSVLSCGHWQRQPWAGHRAQAKRGARNKQEYSEEFAHIQVLLPWHW